MRARIRRLQAEIASDRDAFLRRLDDLAQLELAAGNEGDLARAAVALHHGYGAAEALLTRLARTLGEGLPEGADWHQALLHAMTLEIPEVRPAVLSPESAELLRRLLGFRHFFRHAYAVALDPARLSGLREDALRLRPLLVGEVARIDAFLSQVADAAGD